MAHAGHETSLHPLAIHLCSALLSQPGVERVHLEGASLFALNDTFAKLTTNAPEESRWLAELDRSFERLDRGGMLEVRIRDRFYMRPSAHPEKKYGANTLSAVAARMSGLYDDVVNLKPEAITFGRVARGNEEIASGWLHVAKHLHDARETQTSAIDENAPFANGWTLFRHAWTVPMVAYVLPSGLWFVGDGLYHGTYGREFGAGIAMAGLGAFWAAVHGPELVRYAGGFISDELKTRFLNRYDQHRVSYTCDFPIDACAAPERVPGDEPVFGYAWEGAVVSVETMNALLALKENDQIPVEAVIQTLRHGQQPFREIPEVDRRYVFFDMIYYDGRAGDLPLLMTFLRFKKPEDMVGPKKPKKDQAPVRTEDWIPGAAPSRT